MTNLPADHSQRTLCLDANQSFSVRAPAGSGKTELLTQRVLTLLARVNKPEDILCITFTRKAAGEMLDRILQTLRWAATTNEPESGHKQQSWQLARRALEWDRQQGWMLLDNPSRLRILTIDGLCSRLTKGLPTLSHFGAQPEIVGDAYPLYQQAVLRLLEQLEQDNEVADALARLLTHLDNRVEDVERLLIALLAKRDQWLDIIGMGDHIREARGWLEQSLTCLLQEELLSLTNQLILHGSDLASLADYAATNLEPEHQQSALRYCLGLVELPKTNAGALPQWKGIAELLLKNDGDWRASINKRQGFPTGNSKAEKEQAKAKKAELKELIGLCAEIPGLKQRLGRVRILPNDQYNDQQWALLEALTILLPHLVAQLSVCFAEQSAVDYAQITSGALQALGDEDNPTDLSLLLDYQIQHILVDEFQDTSTPQISLLTKLTQGWEPGDGRTLFIVGDGMQSCYGFRDANVGLFLNARKNGIGDVPLRAADLCVNFRSQQQIVDWVNEVFCGAFPAQDDIGRGAVSYEPSQAFNPPLKGEHISIDLYAGYEHRQAEAERVVELVKQAYCRDDEGTVAILVRNRTHLREILPALRQAELNWQANDIDALATRMWVVDAVSLIRAISNPTDRIAWLSILRAPWCGLTNPDLLALAGCDGKNLSIWTNLCNYQQRALTHDGQARVYKLLEVLSPALQNRLRKPLRSTIEGIWLALGGSACLSAQSQLDDVKRVFELLESHDKGGQLEDLSLFYRDLERLYAAPDSDADPRLQVMTIHKSKGLEFDTVILAGLDRSPRVEDKALLLWQQRLTLKGHQDLLLGPLAATGDDTDPLYQYLRQEQALRNEMEGTRLLYVGVTRAVNHLHLLSHLKLDSRSGEPKAPANRSLLASIWPFIKDQACIHCNDENETETIDKLRLRQIRRLPDRHQPPRLNNENLLAEELFSDLASSSQDNLPSQNWQQTARHIGTLTHRILRQLVIHPQCYPAGENLANYYPAWRQQLRQLNVPAAELDNAVQQVATQISNILRDDKARWILNPNHRDSACELALSYFNGYQTVQQVIDRTFIDELGNRWIIDYKTATPTAGQTIEDFILEEVGLYKGQLKGYAKAFSAKEKNPIKTALYFSECSYFHEVSLSE